MTQLKNDVAALRRLFEPWLAASGDTLIWPPEDSDGNALFKRELFAKAQEILAVGDNAISGTAFHLPELGNLEFRAIDQALGADPLKSEWVELSTACKRVVQSLTQAAA